MSKLKRKGLLCIVLGLLLSLALFAGTAVTSFGARKVAPQPTTNAMTLQADDLDDAKEQAVGLYGNFIGMVNEMLENYLIAYTDGYDSITYAMINSALGDRRSITFDGVTTIGQIYLGLGKNISEIVNTWENAVDLNFTELESDYRGSWYAISDSLALATKVYFGEFLLGVNEQIKALGIPATATQAEELLKNGVAAWSSGLPTSFSMDDIVDDATVPYTFSINTALLADYATALNLLYGGTTNLSNILFESQQLSTAIGNFETAVAAENNVYSPIWENEVKTEYELRLGANEGLSAWLEEEIAKVTSIAELGDLADAYWGSTVYTEAPTTIAGKLGELRADFTTLNGYVTNFETAIDDLLGDANSTGFEDKIIDRLFADSITDSAGDYAAVITTMVGAEDVADDTYYNEIIAAVALVQEMVDFITAAEDQNDTYTPHVADTWTLQAVEGEFILAADELLEDLVADILAADVTDTDALEIIALEYWGVDAYDVAPDTVTAGKLFDLAEAYQDVETKGSAIIAEIGGLLADAADVPGNDYSIEVETALMAWVEDYAAEYDVSADAYGLVLAMLSVVDMDDLSDVATVYNDAMAKIELLGNGLTFINNVITLNVDFKLTDDPTAGEYNYALWEVYVQSAYDSAFAGLLGDLVDGDGIFYADDDTAFTDYVNAFWGVGNNYDAVLDVTDVNTASILGNLWTFYNTVDEHVKAILEDISQLLDRATEMDDTYDNGTGYYVAVEALTNSIIDEYLGAAGRLVTAVDETDLASVKAEADNDVALIGFMLDFIDAANAEHDDYTANDPFALWEEEVQNEYKARAMTNTDSLFVEMRVQIFAATNLAGLDTVASDYYGAAAVAFDEDYKDNLTAELISSTAGFYGTMRDFFGELNGFVADFKTEIANLLDRAEDSEYESQIWSVLYRDGVLDSANDDTYDIAMGTLLDFAVDNIDDAEEYYGELIVAINLANGMLDFIDAANAEHGDYTDSEPFTLWEIEVQDEYVARAMTNGDSLFVEMRVRIFAATDLAGLDTVAYNYYGATAPSAYDNNYLQDLTDALKDSEDGYYGDLRGEFAYLDADVKDIIDRLEKLYNKMDGTLVDDGAIWGIFSDWVADFDGTVDPVADRWYGIVAAMVKAPFDPSYERSFLYDDTKDEIKFLDAMVDFIIALEAERVMFEGTSDNMFDLWEVEVQNEYNRFDRELALREGCMTRLYENTTNMGELDAIIAGYWGSTVFEVDENGNVTAIEEAVDGVIFYYRADFDTLNGYVVDVKGDKFEFINGAMNDLYDAVQDAISITFDHVSTDYNGEIETLLTAYVLGYDGSIDGLDRLEGVINALVKAYDVQDRNVADSANYDEIMAEIAVISHELETQLAYDRLLEAVTEYLVNNVEDYDLTGFDVLVFGGVIITTAEIDDSDYLSHMFDINDWFETWAEDLLDYAFAAIKVQMVDDLDEYIGEFAQLTGILADERLAGFYVQSVIDDIKNQFENDFDGLVSAFNASITLEFDATLIADFLGLTADLEDLLDAKMLEAYNHVEQAAFEYVMYQVYNYAKKYAEDNYDKPEWDILYSLIELDVPEFSSIYTDALDGIFGDCWTDLVLEALYTALTDMRANALTNPEFNADIHNFARIFDIIDHLEKNAEDYMNGSEYHNDFDGFDILAELSGLDTNGDVYENFVKYALWIRLYAYERDFSVEFETTFDGGATIFDYYRISDREKMYGEYENSFELTDGALNAILDWAMEHYGEALGGATIRTAVEMIVNKRIDDVLALYYAGLLDMDNLGADAIKDRVAEGMRLAADGLGLITLSTTFADADSRHEEFIRDIQRIIEDALLEGYRYAAKLIFMAKSKTYVDDSAYDGSQYIENFETDMLEHVYFADFSGYISDATSILEIKSELDDALVFLWDAFALATRKAQLEDYFYSEVAEYNALSYVETSDFDDTYTAFFGVNGVVTNATTLEALGADVGDEGSIWEALATEIDRVGQLVYTQKLAEAAFAELVDTLVDANTYVETTDFDELYRLYFGDVNADIKNAFYYTQIVSSGLDFADDSGVTTDLEYILDTDNEFGGFWADLRAAMIAHAASVEKDGFARNAFAEYVKNFDDSVTDLGDNVVFDAVAHIANLLDDPLYEDYTVYFMERFGDDLKAYEVVVYDEYISVIDTIYNAYFGIAGEITLNSDPEVIAELLDEAKAAVLLKVVQLMFKGVILDSVPAELYIYETDVDGDFVRDGSGNLVVEQTIEIGKYKVLFDALNNKYWHFSTGVTAFENDLDKTMLEYFDKFCEIVDGIASEGGLYLKKNKYINEIKWMLYILAYTESGVTKSYLTAYYLGEVNRQLSIVENANTESVAETAYFAAIREIRDGINGHTKTIEAKMLSQLDFKAHTDSPNKADLRDVESVMFEDREEIFRIYTAIYFISIYNTNMADSTYALIEAMYQRALRTFAIEFEIDTDFFDVSFANDTVALGEPVINGTKKTYTQFYLKNYKLNFTFIGEEGYDFKMLSVFDYAEQVDGTWEYELMGDYTRVLSEIVTTGVDAYKITHLDFLSGAAFDFEENKTIECPGTEDKWGTEIYKNTGVFSKNVGKVVVETDYKLYYLDVVVVLDSETHNEVSFGSGTIVRYVGDDAFVVTYTPGMGVFFFGETDREIILDDVMFHAFFSGINVVFDGYRLWNITGDEVDEDGHKEADTVNNRMTIYARFITVDTNPGISNVPNQFTGEEPIAFDFESGVGTIYYSDVASEEYTNMIADDDDIETADIFVAAPLASATGYVVVSELEPYGTRPAFIYDRIENGVFNSSTFAEVGGKGGAILEIELTLDGSVTDIVIFWYGNGGEVVAVSSFIIVVEAYETITITFNDEENDIEDLDIEVLYRNSLVTQYTMFEGEEVVTINGTDAFENSEDPSLNLVANKNYEGVIFGGWVYNLDGTYFVLPYDITLAELTLNHILDGIDAALVATLSVEARWYNVEQLEAEDFEIVSPYTHDIAYDTYTDAEVEYVTGATVSLNGVYDREVLKDLDGKYVAAGNRADKLMLAVRSILAFVETETDEENYISTVYANDGLQIVTTSAATQEWDGRSGAGVSVIGFAVGMDFLGNSKWDFESLFDFYNTWFDIEEIDDPATTDVVETVEYWVIPFSIALVDADLKGVAYELTLKLKVYNEYTVTYEYVNGIAANVESKTVAYADCAIAYGYEDAAALEHNYRGYDFVEWQLVTTDNKNREDLQDYTFTERVYEDITLRAVWELWKFNVKYYDTTVAAGNLINTIENIDWGTKIDFNSTKLADYMETMTNKARAFAGWKFAAGTTLADGTSLAGEWVNHETLVKINSDYDIVHANGQPINLIAVWVAMEMVTGLELDIAPVNMFGVENANFEDTDYEGFDSAFVLDYADIVDFDAYAESPEYTDAYAEGNVLYAKVNMVRRMLSNPQFRTAPQYKVVVNGNSIEAFDIEEFSTYGFSTLLPPTLKYSFDIPVAELDANGEWVAYGTGNRADAEPSAETYIEIYLYDVMGEMVYAYNGVFTQMNYQEVEVTFDFNYKYNGLKSADDRFVVKSVPMLFGNSVKETEELRNEVTALDNTDSLWIPVGEDVSERAGYTFKFWELYTNKIDLEKANYDEYYTMPITRDLALVAACEMDEVEYEFRYKPFRSTTPVMGNGWEIAKTLVGDKLVRISTTTYEYDDVLEVPVPYLAGYVFQYWTTYGDYTTNVGPDVDNANDHSADYFIYDETDPDWNVVDGVENADTLIMEGGDHYVGACGEADGTKVILYAYFVAEVLTVEVIGDYVEESGVWVTNDKTYYINYLDKLVEGYADVTDPSTYDGTQVTLLDIPALARMDQGEVFVGFKYVGGDKDGQWYEDDTRISSSTTLEAVWAETETLNIISGVPYSMSADGKNPNLDFNYVSYFTFDKTGAARKNFELSYFIDEDIAAGTIDFIDDVIYMDIVIGLPEGTKTIAHELTGAELLKNADDSEIWTDEKGASYIVLRIQIGEVDTTGTEDMNVYSGNAGQFVLWTYGADEELIEVYAEEITVEDYSEFLNTTPHQITTSTAINGYIYERLDGLWRWVRASGYFNAIDYLEPEAGSAETDGELYNAYIQLKDTDLPAAAGDADLQIELFRGFYAECESKFAALDTFQKFLEAYEGLKEEHYSPDNWIKVKEQFYLGKTAILGAGTEAETAYSIYLGRMINDINNLWDDLADHKNEITKELNKYLGTKLSKDSSDPQEQAYYAIFETYLSAISAINLPDHADTHLSNEYDNLIREMYSELKEEVDKLDTLARAYVDLYVEAKGHITHINTELVKVNMDENHRIYENGKEEIWDLFDEYAALIGTDRVSDFDINEFRKYSKYMDDSCDVTCGAIRNYNLQTEAWFFDIVNELWTIYHGTYGTGDLEAQVIGNVVTIIGTVTFSSGAVDNITFIHKAQIVDALYEFQFIFSAVDQTYNPAVKLAHTRLVELKKIADASNLKVDPVAAMFEAQVNAMRVRGGDDNQVIVAANAIEWAIWYGGEFLPEFHGLTLAQQDDLCHRMLNLKLSEIKNQDLSQVMGEMYRFIVGAVESAKTHGYYFLTEADIDALNEKYETDFETLDDVIAEFLITYEDYAESEAQEIVGGRSMYMMGDDEEEEEPTEEEPTEEEPTEEEPTEEEIAEAARIALTVERYLTAYGNGSDLTFLRFADRDELDYLANFYFTAANEGTYGYNLLKIYFTESDIDALRAMNKYAQNIYRVEINVDMFIDDYLTYEDAKVVIDELLELFATNGTTIVRLNGESDTDYEVITDGKITTFVIENWYASTESRNLGNATIEIEDGADYRRLVSVEVDGSDYVSLAEKKANETHEVEIKDLTLSADKKATDDAHIFEFMPNVINIVVDSYRYYLEFNENIPTLSSKDLVETGDTDYYALAAHSSIFIPYGWTVEEWFEKEVYTTGDYVTELAKFLANFELKLDSHKFEGWFDADGNPFYLANNADDSIMATYVCNDIDLHAEWTVNTYTVIVEYGDNAENWYEVIEIPWGYTINRYLREIHNSHIPANYIPVNSDKEVFGGWYVVEKFESGVAVYDTTKFSFDTTQITHNTYTAGATGEILIYVYWTQLVSAPNLGLELDTRNIGKNANSAELIDVDAFAANNPTDPYDYDRFATKIFNYTDIVKFEEGAAGTYTNYTTDDAENGDYMFVKVNFAGYAKATKYVIDDLYKEGREYGFNNIGSGHFVYLAIAQFNGSTWEAIDGTQHFTVEAYDALGKRIALYEFSIDVHEYYEVTVEFFYHATTDVKNEEAKIRVPINFIYGGAISFEHTVKVEDGEEEDGTPIYKDVIVTESNLNKQVTGYTFIGWYSNEFYHEIGEDTLVDLENTRLYADKKYYSFWQIDTYTVEFWAADGVTFIGELSGIEFGDNVNSLTDAYALADIENLAQEHITSGIFAGWVASATDKADVLVLAPAGGSDVITANLAGNYVYNENGTNVLRLVLNVVSIEQLEAVDFRISNSGMDVINFEGTVAMDYKDIMDFFTCTDADCAGGDDCEPTHAGNFTVELALKANAAATATDSFEVHNTKIGNGADLYVGYGTGDNAQAIYTVATVTDGVYTARGTGSRQSYDYSYLYEVYYFNTDGVIVGYAWAHVGLRNYQEVTVHFDLNNTDIDEINEEDYDSFERKALYGNGFDLEAEYENMYEVEVNGLTEIFPKAGRTLVGFMIATKGGESMYSTPRVYLVDEDLYNAAFDTTSDEYAWLAESFGNDGVLGWNIGLYDDLTFSGTTYLVAVYAFTPIFIEYYDYAEEEDIIKGKNGYSATPTDDSTSINYGTIITPAELAFADNNGYADAYWTEDNEWSLYIGSNGELKGQPKPFVFEGNYITENVQLYAFYLPHTLTINYYQEIEGENVLVCEQTYYYGEEVSQYYGTDGAMRIGEYDILAGWINEDGVRFDFTTRAGWENADFWGDFSNLSIDLYAMITDYAALPVASFEDGHFYTYITDGEDNMTIVELPLVDGEFSFSFYQPDTITEGYIFDAMGFGETISSIDWSVVGNDTYYSFEIAAPTADVTEVVLRTNNENGIINTTYPVVDGIVKIPEMFLVSLAGATGSMPLAGYSETFTLIWFEDEAAVIAQHLTITMTGYYTDVENIMTDMMKTDLNALLIAEGDLDEGETKYSQVEEFFLAIITDFAPIVNYLESGLNAAKVTEFRNWLNSRFGDTLDSLRAERIERDEEESGSQYSEANKKAFEAVVGLYKTNIASAKTFADAYELYLAACEYIATVDLVESDKSIYSKMVKDLADKILRDYGIIDQDGTLLDEIYEDLYYAVYGKEAVMDGEDVVDPAIVGIIETAAEAITKKNNDAEMNQIVNDALAEIRALIWRDAAIRAIDKAVEEAYRGSDDDRKVAYANAVSTFKNSIKDESDENEIIRLKGEAIAEINKLALENLKTDKIAELEELIAEDYSYITDLKANMFEALLFHYSETITRLTTADSVNTAFDDAEKAFEAIETAIGDVDEVINGYIDGNYDYAFSADDFAKVYEDFLNALAILTSKPAQLATSAIVKIDAIATLAEYKQDAKNAIDVKVLAETTVTNEGIFEFITEHYKAEIDNATVEADINGFVTDAETAIENIADAYAEVEKAIAAFTDPEDVEFTYSFSDEDFAGIKTDFLTAIADKLTEFGTEAEAAIVAIKHEGTRLDTIAAIEALYDGYVEEDSYDRISDVLRDAVDAAIAAINAEDATTTDIAGILTSLKADLSARKAAYTEVFEYMVENLVIDVALTYDKYEEIIETFIENLAAATEGYDELATAAIDAIDLVVAKAYAIAEVEARYNAYISETAENGYNGIYGVDSTVLEGSLEAAKEAINAATDDVDSIKGAALTDLDNRANAYSTVFNHVNDVIIAEYDNGVTFEASDFTGITDAFVTALIEAEGGYNGPENIAIDAINLLVDKRVAVAAVEARYDAYISEEGFEIDETTISEVDSTVLEGTLEAAIAAINGAETANEVTTFKTNALTDLDNRANAYNTLFSYVVEVVDAEYANEVEFEADDFAEITEAFIAKLIDADGDYDALAEATKIAIDLVVAKAEAIAAVEARYDAYISEEGFELDETTISKVDSTVLEGTLEAAIPAINGAETANEVATILTNALTDLDNRANAYNTVFSYVVEVVDAEYANEVEFEADDFAEITDAFVAALIAADGEYGTLVEATKIAIDLVVAKAEAVAELEARFNAYISEEGFELNETTISEVDGNAFTGIVEIAVIAINEAGNAGDVTTAMNNAFTLLNAKAAAYYAASSYVDSIIAAEYDNAVEFAKADFADIMAELAWEIADVTSGYNPLITTAKTAINLVVAKKVALAAVAAKLEDIVGTESLYAEDAFDAIMDNYNRKIEAAETVSEVNGIVENAEVALSSEAKRLDYIRDQEALGEEMAEVVSDIREYDIPAAYATNESAEELFEIARKEALRQAQNVTTLEEVEAILEALEKEFERIVKVLEGYEAQKKQALEQDYIEDLLESLLGGLISNKTQSISAINALTVNVDKIAGDAMNNVVSKAALTVKAEADIKAAVIAYMNSIQAIDSATNPANGIATAEAKLFADIGVILHQEDARNKAAAQVVVDAIEALDSKAKKDDKSVIAAREMYDALTERQKADVNNYYKLESLENPSNLNILVWITIILLVLLIVIAIIILVFVRRRNDSNGSDDDEGKKKE